MLQIITFRFLKQQIHLATSKHLPVEELEISRTVSDYLSKAEAAKLMADVKHEAWLNLGSCHYMGYSISHL